jgi:TPR repeat protein
MIRVGVNLARARLHCNTGIGISSHHHRVSIGTALAAGTSIIAAGSILALSHENSSQSQRSSQLKLARASVASNGAKSLLGDFLSSTKESITNCTSSESLEYEQVYPEAEEFREVLEYYRQQLSWYKKQWSGSKSPISAHWPRNIPSDAETPALELDLKFCKRNLALAGDKNQSAAKKKCQDLQFRIASNYVRSTDETKQFQGYKLVKELAEQEHADGMCLYGIILNEGKIAGIDANPNQAVVWWRRSIDLCMHIPSQYEYAVALYTGEGVPEDPSRAVMIFHKAANLHVGAAYMLGECLLDGVGVKRHRAAALEWLIVAAELGHKKAQSRVLAILEGYPDVVSDEEDSKRPQKPSNRPNVKLEKRFTIGGASTLEKRYSIGGGSRNPKIKQRRNSIVQESREDGTDS